MELRLLNEGRELVSRATRLMALSPDYLIRRAFDFESVDAFHLAVGSWVCNRYVLDLNAGVLAVIPEFLRSEV